MLSVAISSSSSSSTSSCTRRRCPSVSSFGGMPRCLPGSPLMKASRQPEISPCADVSRSRSGPCQVRGMQKTLRTNEKYDKRLPRSERLSRL